MNKIVKKEQLSERVYRFEVEAPLANTPASDLWVVTTPEVIADERKKNLSDFINKADSIITIDKLTTNDIFSVTADGFDGTATATYGVYLNNAGGVKPTISSVSTNMGTKIGEVLDITNSKTAIIVK